MASILIT